MSELKYSHNNFSSIAEYKIYMFKKNISNNTNVTSHHIINLPAFELHTGHDTKSYVHTYIRKTFIKQQEAYLTRTNIHHTTL